MIFFASLSPFKPVCTGALQEIRRGGILQKRSYGLGAGKPPRPVDHNHDAVHAGRRTGRGWTSRKCPPHPIAWHARRRLHLGDGRVLEPDPRGAHPRVRCSLRGGERRVAYRGPRNPHIRQVDARAGRTRQQCRLRPAHRGAAIHRDQDRATGGRLGEDACRSHAAGDHVLQLAAVWHRHERSGPRADLPDTQRRRA